MKTYNYKSEVTTRTMLIGLVNHAITTIRTILFIIFWTGLIFAPIIFLLTKVIDRKTSDENFCPRVVNQELRIKLGCPGNPVASK